MGKVLIEKVWTQPLEATFELRSVLSICLSGTAFEFSLCTQATYIYRLACIAIVHFIVECSCCQTWRIHILIIDACIKYAGILGAYGYRQSLLNGMQEDVVAKNMALN